MPTQIRRYVVATLATLALIASACGGSVPPAPSPSLSVAPPLSGMLSFASRHHATEAWWVQTSLARAFKLEGGGFDPAPSPGTRVYVLVMRGNFGSVHGVRGVWAASIFGVPRHEDFSTNSDPFYTEGLKLTSLSLASP